MSSSPKSLTARGRATRQRLIECARQEILASGSLEVADVAQAADVSPGLMYRYFGSKDGLVAAVVNDFYDSYHKAILAADIAPEAGWFERERIRLTEEIDFLCDEPLARIVIGRQLREPAAAAADAERIAEQIDLAARNVKRGQRQGDIPATLDARLYAAAFMGGFRELMAEALLRTEAPDRGHLLEIIWGFGFGGSLGVSISQIDENLPAEAT